SNTLRSILEDRSGNIWFGTSNGICSYDGKTFTAYPIPVPDSTHLSAYNNTSTKIEVWSMMQDKSGKIWLGTDAGVYCYDGNSFSRFLNNDSILNKEGLHLKMVDCILEDQNGIILFASGMPPGMEGLCRFDGKSLTSYKPNGNGWIRTIIEEKNGDLLLATRHYGVCRYDGKIFTNISEQGGINRSSVWSVLKDRAGNIWMGTELGSGQMDEDGGLWCFNGNFFTKFSTRDGLCHNGVSFILEDKAGDIWLGTRNVGLCRYDGKTFTNFTEE
ncbi:MAG: two-component regulator propeller domain-containing protein, partial [Bacteroidia bacterium]